jgi:hypothetical protein
MSQVRLYLPFSNTNYDLYVERYIVNKWTVVYSSASPNTNNEQVTFTTIPGASYRFRAVRRFGYAAIRSPSHCALVSWASV